MSQRTESPLVPRPFTYLGPSFLSVPSVYMLSSLSYNSHTHTQPHPTPPPQAVDYQERRSDRRHRQSSDRRRRHSRRAHGAMRPVQGSHQETVYANKLILRVHSGSREKKRRREERGGVDPTSCSTHHPPPDRNAGVVVVSRLPGEYSAPIDRPVEICGIPQLFIL